MTLLQANWIDRKAEGWAWYEDLKPQEKKTQEEDLQPPSVSSLKASEKAKMIRKNLEEKLSAAVLDPTHENVRAYMQEQHKWLDQSAKFSKVWAQVLLQDPDLDETLSGHPTSQYGIQVKKQMERERRHALIKQISSDYGLFFFYEGDSKPSQAFALVVSEFEHKHDWEVLAVSMDGLLLEGFKSNQVNNGIAEKWNIRHYPALFLVNPKTENVVPISFGLTSLDQIESNIVLQFSGVEL